MKRIIVLCMVLGFGLSIFGQTHNPQKRQVENRDPKARQEQMLTRMNELLTLTPEQSEKIKSIMDQRMADAAKERAEREKKMAELKEKGKAKMEAMREKNEAYQKEIKAVLTPEQLAKYDEFLQKQQDRMKAHRNQPKGRRPGQKKGGEE